ncbi:hypothetical protein FRC06_005111 [Ceratobasidium sp. 370]|nr:hypothetical protein FRC06_005111 [Ceratobasidium sp. 370]
MSDTPYDQQPTRSSHFARIFGPARPIEPDATVVAHALAPPPFLSPPDYRRLTPGPPGYPLSVTAPGPVLAPLRRLARSPPPPPWFTHRIGRPLTPVLGLEATPGPAHAPEQATPGPARVPEQAAPVHGGPDPMPSNPTNSGTNAEPEPEPELESKFYTAWVTLERTELVQPRSGVRGRPSKEVTEADSKPIELDIANTTRPLLIRSMLKAHKLEHRYRISNLHGPAIKIHWRGSPGGAKLACRLVDNQEWERVQALILKKDPETTPIYASFHVDDLQHFRIYTRDEPDEGFDEDARAGSSYKASRVTRVGNPAEGSDVHTLHGRKIQDLENRWVCQDHPGGPRCCYRPTPNGSHVELNMWRLKMWAAAIYAGRATLEIPPQIPEFVATQDPGGPSTSRSRHAAPASNTSTAEVGTLVSSIMAPVAASLAGVMSAMARAPNVPAPPVLSVPTPIPPTSMSRLVRTPPLIPNPTPEALISTCLDAFLEHTGIDFSGRKEYLVHNLLTPNLISDVPFEHLLAKLGAPVGHVVQYRQFCYDWAQKYNDMSRN